MRAKQLIAEANKYNVPRYISVCRVCGYTGDCFVFFTSLTFLSRLSVSLVLFVFACAVPVACSLFKSMRAINTTDVRIKLLYFITFYNGQQILAYNSYNKSIIIGVIENAQLQ